eukprot:2908302-Pleurochrysis_carterae.AAC.1
MASGMHISAVTHSYHGSSSMSRGCTIGNKVQLAQPQQIHQTKVAIPRKTVVLDLVTITHS